MLLSSRIVVAGVMVLTEVLASLLVSVLSKRVDNPAAGLIALVFVFAVPPMGFSLAVRMRGEAKRSSPFPTLLVVFVNILFAGVDIALDGSSSAAVLVSGLAVVVFVAAFAGTFARAGARRAVTATGAGIDAAAGGP